MLKKKLSIAFIILMFLINVVFWVPHKEFYRIVEVKSPIEFILDKRDFVIKDLDTFDSNFTKHNQELAKELNISETEAFAMGNLGKYWTSSLMNGRKVFIKNDSDLIFVKYSYKKKFLQSPYCIQEGKPANLKSFESKLKQIRKGLYRIYDLDTKKTYKLDDLKIRELQNFLLLRKSQIPKAKQKVISAKKPARIMFVQNNLKVFLSDSMTNLVPTRSCSTDVCKEILSNINSAKETIDIVIYGYSDVPEIKKALESAISRGVKVRLVYDSEKSGANIYPNTKDMVELVSENKSDKDSVESKNIMHNKFYIFDDKVLITGSANLSHTDMSGFNTNSVVAINSSEIVKVYKEEFEQMFSGKFHNEKSSSGVKIFKLDDSEIEVYFSPQDKAIMNAVLPLINKAEKYIYIPTFVLTEKRVTEALIKAKNRGVDVKIIMDALNASIKHTKHWELRNAKISVKTENYAGKMHSKSMIVDDKYTIIGSMNFSNSGENRNDENLMVIKNPNIARFYREFFEYQWSKIDDKWLTKNVRAESIDSIGSCYDGIDNNYDGLVDSNDPACKK